MTEPARAIPAALASRRIPELEREIRPASQLGCPGPTYQKTKKTKHNKDLKKNPSVGRLQISPRSLVFLVFLFFLVGVGVDSLVSFLVWPPGWASPDSA